MPLSPEHKQQTRHKILESAAFLFTQKGFEQVSIDQVMTNAGLTRGAFYAHFDSKSELYQAAIKAAAQQSELVRPKPQEISDKDWVERLLKTYLSPEHVQHQSIPCPLAFLTTDVVNREEIVRDTYTQVFKNMQVLLHNYLKTYSNCTQDQVMALVAMAIGGVAVGRALNDEKEVARLLEACLASANNLIQGYDNKK